MKRSASGAALFAALATVATLATAAAPVAAQSFLLPSSPGKGIVLEGTHADYKDIDASFASSVWYLTGRLPVLPRLTAVVDVPFSYAKVDFSELGEQSNSVFGNPYVGVELAPVRRLTLEVGTRLPLTSADDESFADVLAAIADPQRIEAFLDNSVPVIGAAVFTQPLANGFAVRARAGMTGLFYTGDDDDVDNEAAIDYGAAGSWSRGIARVALGFTGRWYASADEGSFADNSFHHAGLSADVNVLGFRPGVSLRLPIDGDYRKVVGPSFGMYLELPIR